MESTAGIAVFAAILTIAGLLGLLSSFFRRVEDEVRVGGFVDARKALTGKRLAIRRRRRERIVELRGKLRSRSGLAPAARPVSIPAGLSPEDAGHARDLEIARKQAKEAPEEAAAVLRALLRGGKEA